ncbi:MAG: Crp/Fnr family transcriptional regulator, partial [Woeseia sp.]
MPEPHYPQQNLLLAALPEESYARLQDGLELVAMPLGWTLSGSGGTLKNAYFPTSSIISLLCVTIDGDSSEIAVAGNEGMVGISLFLGEQGSSNRVVVQSAGHGYRLKREYAQREFARGGVFQKLMLRFTQTLLTQMGQTSVCNRHHSIDQQLCR